MRTSLLALALALAYGVATPAHAAPVDLSGTWVLDLEASDSVEPLLAAHGVSWAQRKAAAAMNVTKTITQDDDTLTVKTSSKAKQTNETVSVDGVARTRPADGGGSESVTHRWEGAAWVTTTLSEDPKAVTTQTHTLSADGKTLTVRVRYEGAGAAPIVVERLFRRR